MPKQLMKMNTENETNGIQLHDVKSCPISCRYEYMPSDNRPTNAPDVENMSNVLRPIRSTNTVEPYTPSIWMTATIMDELFGSNSESLYSSGLSNPAAWKIFAVQLMYANVPLNKLMAVREMPIKMPLIDFH